MQRQCLDGPINSYHSFCWSNLTLCIHNVDTLNMCMKEFDSQKNIIDKMTIFPDCITKGLCLFFHITGTLEICMKKFDAEKIIYDKMAALLT